MSDADGLTEYARSLTSLGRARLAVQEYSCDYDGHSANIDRLILEVRAEIPCYWQWTELPEIAEDCAALQVLIPWCPSCTARAELAKVTA